MHFYIFKFFDRPLLHFYSFRPSNRDQNTVHGRSRSSILVQMTVQIGLRTETYFWHNFITWLLIINCSDTFQPHFLLVKVVDQQFLKNYFASAIRKIDLKAKTKCTTRFSTLKTIHLDSLREKIKFSRLLFSQSFDGRLKRFIWVTSKNRWFVTESVLWEMNSHKPKTLHIDTIMKGPLKSGFVLRLSFQPF